MSYLVTVLNTYGFEYKQHVVSTEDEIAELIAPCQLVNLSPFGLLARPYKWSVYTMGERMVEGINFAGEYVREPNYNNFDPDLAYNKRWGDLNMKIVERAAELVQERRDKLTSDMRKLTQIMEELDGNVTPSLIERRFRIRYKDGKLQYLDRDGDNEGAS